MLENTVIAIATFAGLLGLVSVWSSALALATTWLFSIQSRIVRRGLKRFLRLVRVRHFYRIGLNLSKYRMSRLVHREAAIFLSDQLWDIDSTSHPPLPRWYSSARLKTNQEELSSLMPDLNEEEREETAQGISRLIGVLDGRLALMRRVLAGVFAAPLCLLFGLDALRLPEQMLQGFVGWQSATAGFAAQLDNLLAEPSRMIGLGISVLLAAVVGGRLFDIVSSRVESAQMRAPPLRIRPDKSSAAPDSGADGPMIGRDDCAIRALTFSGGAFDTVMQLGVAHAFCVSQAQPPDAVVGISAGTLHAVSLAEVLQAGEDSERNKIEQALKLEPGKRIADDDKRKWWGNLSPQQRRDAQRARLLARTNRLRFFVEYAQRSPELLFDALTPGSYQPNSYHPLQALQQPRFSKKERDKKEEAIIARAGLVRIYNDLLNIPLSIGTITRFVRRILGIMAAAEIQNRIGRIFVRAVEIFRITILTGSRLIHFAPLTAIFLRSLSKPTIHTATAGTLIARSQLLSQIGRFLQACIAFVGLVHVWVLLGILLLLPLIVLIGVLFWQIQWEAALVTFLLAIVGVSAILSIGKQLSPFERESIGLTFTASLKDSVIFLSFVAIWSAVLFGMHALVWTVVARFMDDLTISFDLDGSFIGVVAISAASAMTILLVSLGLRIVRIRSAESSLPDRLLQSYRLGASLLSTHEIGTFLSTLFDPDYYRTPEMDDIVDASLNNQRSVDKRHAGAGTRKKTMSHYSDCSRLEPIHVGAAAADVATGQLKVLPGKTPVITALLAATSYTPVFPPIKIGSTLFVDGAKVTSEPTSALMRMLRSTVNENSKILHLYNVVPFPMSKPELSLDEDHDRQSKDGVFLNLVDIVVRALRLQRYRDATIERQLTELFNRAIPAKDFVASIPDRKRPGKEKRYFRAWVTPIERDTGKSVTARVITEEKDGRRAAIAKTIADGCRAALQVMIHNDQREGTSDEVDGSNNSHSQSSFISCRDAVEQYFGRRIGNCGEELQFDFELIPGSSNKDTDGPGLPEICRHCRLRSRHTSAESESDQADTAKSESGQLRQHLDFGEKWDSVTPTWPHEREYRESEDLDPDARFVSCDSDAENSAVTSLDTLRRRLQSLQGQEFGHWPLKRTAEGDSSGESEPTRPTTSMLFGGGVFRGVYQVGVLSGLSQMNLQPDLVAGASVGSITAAMVADTFAGRNERARNARIARLAAVYVAVDRLILTDRFADFVRDFTLRASESRFSIRQVDRLLRKYDYPSFREFNHNARRVAAGLERLLYIDPFQLTKLIRLTKGGDSSDAINLLSKVSQGVLDRSQVGTEALGSEPLQLLIDRYVSDELGSQFEVGPTFDDFRETASIQILATATNLTKGRLEVFGSVPEDPTVAGATSTILKEGLLASSAFPGIFRPRWSWEVRPGASEPQQYIDGGVMDNLPLDAVAKFLNEAAQANLICRRPNAGDTPHLVIAASLEVNAKEFKLPTTRAEFEHSWLLLNQRNSELKYNTKLDSYAATERALRDIARKKLEESGSHPGELIDLEVLSIKPDWLCGTYAFHPMLGFRRRRQKESIAHGCAGTLLTLAARENDMDSSSLRNWGGDVDGLPAASNWVDAFARLPLDKRKASKGYCWLRDRICPFSKQGLSDSGCGHSNNRLPKRTCEELTGIYSVCRLAETHLRPV